MSTAFDPEHGRPPILLAALLSICSGALFFFGTGLNPIASLTWMAPVPVLWLAPRVGARVAGIAAFVAYLAGTTNIAGYYLSELGLPVLGIAGVVLGTSALFCAAVMAFRGLIARERLTLAALTFAATLAAAEYAVATVAPGGANWSLAPSQASFLVIVQVVSATGIWGLSFLVAFVPAAAAAFLAPGAPRTARLRVAVVASAMVATSLSYGVVRLTRDDGNAAIHVALVSTHLPASSPVVDVRDEAGQQLLGADIAALGQLRQGTDVAVFPEKDLIVDDRNLPDVSARFSAAARASHVSVVVGLELHASGRIYNMALVYPASGGSPTSYRKQYLLPGAEDDLTTGHTDAFASIGGHRIGVAICADMGHPILGRSYARGGAVLMLVPALDFTVDKTSQSRVQYLRGVENGYGVARTARWGYLTVTDPRGRLLAQRPADDGSAATVVSATVPLRSATTLYTRWGDWFAWLCLLIALVGAGSLLWRPRGRRPEDAIARWGTPFVHVYDY
ncbi:MAG: hypothetical protein DLM59_17815 [Pseudonocardiales bacterium]|nr:MAG: hypothetical protein DLM59_17815 [Pseudonocardiales bacterium]